MSATRQRACRSDPGSGGMGGDPEPDAAPPGRSTRDAQRRLADHRGRVSRASRPRAACARSPRRAIVVLEARAVAEGAAGRNSGFMIDLPHELTSADYAGGGRTTDRRTIALNRHAIAFAAEARRRIRHSGRLLRPAPARSTAQRARRPTSSTASYAAHLAALGEPHEMLDAKAMREITGSATTPRASSRPAPSCCSPRATCAASPRGSRPRA